MYKYVRILAVKEQGRFDLKQICVVLNQTIASQIGGSFLDLRKTKHSDVQGSENLLLISHARLIAPRVCRT